MTPNVSRLLIKWGVDKIIGDDLVQCKYINMRNREGKVVQRTDLAGKTVRELGFPVSKGDEKETWWKVVFGD